jgi:hypothetical protein
MSESHNPSLTNAYLREINALGEWKSTDGFADPLLELLDASAQKLGANNESRTEKSGPGE